MNHDDNIDNIKFDTVVNPTEFKTSKLIKKVSDYLTDKVDKNLLNNIIYNIENKRENIAFNDDVYFDVIKILTENNKLGIINIDYADLVYYIIKKDNDYSFFLRILPYVCEKTNFALFQELYPLFENKNYLIPILKKIEEIKEYKIEKFLNTDIEQFLFKKSIHDNSFEEVIKKYRNYYIDDKTYLSFIIEVLNTYLKNDVFDYKMELISKEYNFIELEKDINSISNTIDSTNEVAITTKCDINDNIKKLDIEIECTKDNIIETIENNIVNVEDKINDLFNKQKDELYDLIDTKLVKQKKNKRNIRTNKKI